MQSEFSVNERKRGGGCHSIKFNYTMVVIRKNSTTSPLNVKRKKRFNVKSKKIELGKHSEPENQNGSVVLPSKLNFMNSIVLKQNHRI